MKNYGKRKVPRDIEEFKDLIGPYYMKGDFARSADLLLSFWKRKGKSSRAAHFIAPGLLACSFNGNLDIDGRFILERYNVGPDGFAYDKFDEFILYFIDKFLTEYKSVPSFLSRFYNTIEWELPIDLIEKHKTIAEIKSIAPKEIAFNRSWQYGLNNNKIDILTYTLISFELQKLVDFSTKDFRESKGLNPVASRWISEQYLLDKIKTTFPKLIVIGQGNPRWLDGQKFDIWLPELKVAIEYNGLQHYEPVDLFGGQEGFEATQMRDELKRKKCQMNNTALLEVREGFKFENVESWIKEKIKAPNKT